MSIEDERRAFDRERWQGLRDSLLGVQERIDIHVDQDEKRHADIDRSFEATRKDIEDVRAHIPDSHLAQHAALAEFIEERKWMADLRREAIKKGTLWAVGVLALLVVSKIFPGLGIDKLIPDILK